MSCFLKEMTATGYKDEMMEKNGQCSLGSNLASEKSDQLSVLEFKFMLCTYQYHVSLLILCNKQLLREENY